MLASVIDHVQRVSAVKYTLVRFARFTFVLQSQLHQLIIKTVKVS